MGAPSVFAGTLTGRIGTGSGLGVSMMEMRYLRSSTKMEVPSALVIALRVIVSAVSGARPLR